MELFKNLKKFFENIKIRINNKSHHNKKNNAKNKSIAGENNTNNQIADIISNVQSQPVAIQVPMIGEQAKIWFNEQMKAYGCPGNHLSFEQRYNFSHKFLEEVNVARNEFIKWAQDQSEDGINLPSYRDRNAKAKELWTEYVKSPQYNVEDE